MAKSILKQLKENEREVRRQLIVDAAQRLYKNRSFHSIGMRDIASEAGISVASLYQYFPSQDDLFIEILRKELLVIKANLWTDQSSLEEISLSIVDFLLDNEDIFMMMSHFMIKGDKKPKSLKKFKVIQVLFLDILNASLTKESPDENLKFYSQAFFTSLFGNVITFRNYPVPDGMSHRENLYSIVKFTARAFQDAMNSKELTGESV